MDEKKVAVVTGATSGLGESAAVALSEKGFFVWVVGRDAARGADVVKKAEAAGGSARFLSGDLFTVSGVSAVANAIRSRTPRVDLLINNAGGTFGKKELTKDGLERTFALNVMAPFVLTRALMPALAAAQGRVVNLVTGIPNGAKAAISDLTGEKANAGLGSYTKNKLALSALTGESQRRYAKEKVTFVSLHPGIIPGTRFGQDMPAFLRSVMGGMAKLFRFGSSLDEAAARYLKVALGDVEKGAFYNQGNLAEPPPHAKDAAFAAALWAELETRTASARTEKEAASASLS